MEENMNLYRTLFTTILAAALVVGAAGTSSSSGKGQMNGSSGSGSAGAGAGTTSGMSDSVLSGTITMIDSTDSTITLYTPGMGNDTTTVSFNDVTKMSKAKPKVGDKVQITYEKVAKSITPSKKNGAAAGQGGADGSDTNGMPSDTSQMPGGAGSGMPSDTMMNDTLMKDTSNGGMGDGGY